MSVAKKKLKSLVIVESPAKSKTIHKILGNDYVIEASYGHVRNLPESTLGFDVNDNFKPTYVIIPEKKKVVNKLKISQIERFFIWLKFWFICIQNVLKTAIFYHKKTPLFKIEFILYQ